MRICYVLPCFSVNPAGGIRIVYQHAHYLAKRGHDVHVIHPFIEYRVNQDEKDGVPTGLSEKPVSISLAAYVKRKLKQFLPHRILFFAKKIIIKVRIPSFPFWEAKLVPALNEKYLPRNLDALVATWWETAYFVNSTGPSAAGKKFFLCQHYEIWGGAAALVRQAYEFRSLSLISISRWVHDEIKRHHGRESTIVVNGFVYNSFKPMPGRKQSNIVTIGYVFRDKHSFKGYSIFKKINLALSKNKSFQFIVAGIESPNDPELKMRYMKTTSLKRMCRFYQAIDILLFPSEVEGFGLPIIEAMACGTPVLSAPVGIAPDIIEDKVNSFLVSAPVSELFLQRISEFSLLSSVEIEKMRLSAVTATKSFQWEKQITLLEGIFRG